MKKILLFLFALTLWSCQKEKTNCTISGSVTQVDFEKLTLSGINFSKEISIKDGKFSEDVTLPYKGLYQIQLNDELEKYLYLENGFDLQVALDTDNFDDQVTYTGVGADENNYFLQKRATIRSILGKISDWDDLRELFLLDETSFLDKLKQTEREVLALVNKANLSNAAFVEKEKLDLPNFSLRLQYMYPFYHAHFSDDDAFEVSENYPVIPEDFDIDNEDMYLFSLTYRFLCDVYFEKRVEAREPEESEVLTVAFEELDKLNSALIKGELIKDVSDLFSASTPNLEETYQKILTYVLDEDFKKELAERFENFKNLVPGKPSPTFTYENINGGMTSLEDLKGKYVYIDVWATWCAPCIAEIPALKELEKFFHNKNIEFVSISIDNKKDKEKWKNMVAEKGLKGVQLFADQDWNSDFVKQYAIDGIPRFILIDSEGNIILADAPRPSDHKIREMLNRLEL